MVFSWGGGTGGANGTSSLNTSGLTDSSNITTFTLFLIPSFSSGSLFGTNVAGQKFVGGATSPFGPGTLVLFPNNVTTGSSPIGWNHLGEVSLPLGYTSLSPIASGSLSVAGNLTSLGLTPGLINVVDWGDNTADTVIQMMIIDPAVPEPSTYLTLGLLFSFLAGATLHRKRRSRSVTTSEP